MLSSYTSFTLNFSGIQHSSTGWLKYGGYCCHRVKQCSSVALCSDCKLHCCNRTAHKGALLADNTVLRVLLARCSTVWSFLHVLINV
jgi:hypothetical protein